MNTSLRNVPKSEEDQCVCVCVYLTAAQQARLLQSGPDALHSSSMLWVDVSVATHTLMLQHQTVIYKP